MNKMNKISLKHGYTLTENEDGSIFLKVETADNILEFDGKNGNLMDASDFEAHFNEEETEMTLNEIIYGTTEYLKDWGVDEETTEAIVADLTPWFEEYAIEEPKADAWLKVLESRVEELKKKTDTSKKAIEETIAKYRRWVASADDLDIYYEASSKALEIDEIRETYKSVWAKYKEAERELWNYKDTMHIR